MKTKTAPTKNGKANAPTSGAKRHLLHWTTQERQAITDRLNDLLANYQVHYQKLRNFHWNVKGSDFFDLHVELETQYLEAQEHIDLIAERIRVFRLRPLSCMSEYLKLSTIKEVLQVPSSDNMVKEVLADYVVLLDRCIAAVDQATELHDMGTEEMVKGFIKQLQKHHWMLTAFSEG